MELNEYKQFLAERKAGLYDNYKYPNLVEIELRGNIYLEYFAEVTSRLVMAVFRGEEDFTEMELWKVSHFNKIPFNVITCPKLIYLDTSRWKHFCMIQAAIDKYNRLLALAEQGNKEAQKHKSLAAAEYDSDEVIILLGTGLRISEFCGLTTALDFKNRQINVDHQLLRDADIGYYIETPKTKNGIRQILMTEEVCQALKRVLKNRSNAVPFSVEGYKNFLFLKNDGMPKVSANYEGMLKGLVKKYNKQNKEQLPNITPHILRHKFCTRLANAGMNPKALQYIMGHANITMTLNYYAHATYDSAKAEMERLAA